MTDKEYQYNEDLLTLLRNIVIRNTSFDNNVSSHLESYIDELEERLDDIFDKQTEETK